jgi:hypothetical protein
MFMLIWKVGRSQPVRSFVNFRRYETYLLHVSRFGDKRQHQFWKSAETFKLEVITILL